MRADCAKRMRRAPLPTPIEPSDAAGSHAAGYHAPEFALRRTRRDQGVPRLREERARGPGL